MKKLIIGVALLILVPSCAWGGLTTATFQWDEITDPSVVQVRIYQRDIDGTYNYQSPAGVISMPATEITIPDIPNGTWAWVARAVDDGGLESVDSNEVTATFEVPPGTIQNLIIKLTVPQ